jgi:hypothetical protein
LDTCNDGKTNPNPHPNPTLGGNDEKKSAKKIDTIEIKLRPKPPPDFWVAGWELNPNFIA